MIKKETKDDILLKMEYTDKEQFCKTCKYSNQTIVLDEPVTTCYLNRAFNLKISPIGRCKHWNSAASQRPTTGHFKTTIFDE